MTASISAASGAAVRSSRPGTRSLLLATAAAAALLLATPSPARADFHFSLDVATDVPVDFEFGLTLELPGRVRLQTAVGVMPSFYVDLINLVSTEAGWYDDTTATLVSAAIDNSFVWRSHLGWRPLEDWGFFFGAGYGLVLLGGGLTGPELVSAATGQSAGSSSDAGQFEIDSTALLHLVDLEVGWEWVVKDVWVVGVALGGTFTVHSESTMKLDGPSGNAPAWGAALTRAGEQYLDDILGDYVHTVSLNLSVAYRFL